MRRKLHLSLWLAPIKQTTERYISIEITVENGGSTQISTGFRIEPSCWLPHLEREKAKKENRTASAVPSRMKAKTTARQGKNSLTAEEVNTELTAMEADIGKIHRQLNDEDKPFSAEDIKALYLEKHKGEKVGEKLGILSVYDLFLKDLEKKIDDTRQIPDGITRSTYNTYVVRRNNFAQFLLKDFGVKDMDVNRLPESFAEQLKDYLLKRHYNEQTGSLGMVSDATYKNVSCLFTVLKFAKKRRYIREITVEETNVPVKNYRDAPKIYLTVEERERLESTVFHSATLQEVADSFIFAYYSGGLAYNEQSILTHQEHIHKNIKGELWLSVVRQKTERHKKLPVSVPLLPKAIEIMEKYRNHSMTRQGNVLPVPENATYNRILKVIAEVCGIRKKLTTHVARKTFTAICAEHQIPIERTAAMLGDDIKVVQKHYLWITDDMKLESMQTIADSGVKKKKKSA